MHAVPVAVGAAPAASAMRMPSPVLKEVPGEIGFRLSAPAPRCRASISPLPAKPPVASTTAAGGNCLRAFRRACAARSASMAPLPSTQQPLGSALVANADTRFQRGALELPQDGGAAADGLDARRAGAQVVDRPLEGDPVCHEPGDRRRCFGGEASHIGFVHAPTGDRAQVIGEARLDTIRRGHAHIGGAPARVAAVRACGAFSIRVIRQATCLRARRLGGCQRRGEPGAAAADDDNGGGRCHPACTGGMVVPASSSLRTALMNLATRCLETPRSTRWPTPATSPPISPLPS